MKLIRLPTGGLCHGVREGKEWAPPTPDTRRYRTPADLGGNDLRGLRCNLKLAGPKPL